MTDPIDRIFVEGAAPPAGHYSPATAWRDLVFVSGQLPVRPDGSHSFDQPFEVQARQVLDNLLAVLAAAGSSPERVLKVTVYVTGIQHWPAFNRLYAEAFGEAKPARAVVPVPELHHGYLVEVEAIAAR
ncbi:RidA family protein [Sphingoaurantiacus capsulatus]|uniref:RidA family protein n=1 Tax=Sphingoaurantiacus capsulatus TaxID=1771310 RepID=A0ABV7X7C7_9SPHN